MIFKRIILQICTILLLFSFSGLENIIYFPDAGKIYSKTRYKKAKKKKYAKRRYKKKRNKKRSRRRYTRHKRYRQRRRYVRKRQIPKQSPAITLGPVLSFPGPDTISIWWHLNRTYSSHTIEYGTTKYLPYRITSSVQTPYPFLQLPHIVPGLTYKYRIQSGPLKSKIYTFKAMKYNPHFRIGIWADNQNGMGIFKKYTIPALEKQSPTFLLAIGDLVQNGNRYVQWNSQLYGPGRTLFSKIPLLPVRGNHDGEGLFARNMVPFPKEHWYTFRLGPLCLIVLDTNLDYSPGSRQYQWFTKQLKTRQWRTASYRAVALHYPPYTNYFDIRHYSQGKSVRTYLVPLIETYGANIVMSGHAHCYSHGIKNSTHGPTHYFILGGGGGILDRIRIADWPHIVKSEIKYHIAIADVSGDKFELTVINSINEEIIDRVIIKGTPLAQ